MVINSLRGNRSTITDIVFFLWNRHARRILIFVSLNIHLFLRLRSLTIHDTLLITRGRRDFWAVLRMSTWREIQNKRGVTTGVTMNLFEGQPQTTHTTTHTPQGVSLKSNRLHALPVV